MISKYIKKRGLWNVNYKSILGGKTKYLALFVKRYGSPNFITPCNVHHAHQSQKDDIAMNFNPPQTLPTKGNTYCSNHVNIRNQQTRIPIKPISTM